ncbi:MAG: methionyl-tRNA formyltransferase, partial [Bacteroidales bacterium]|nr:methionyl-tRNA formyltransferase [Bacteroidales bacterium]
MRIVFMGTPEFAVASLDAIIKAGHDVAAVVTMPDKPAGRGLKIQKSAVKLHAEEHNLLALQPEKPKDEP